MRIYGVFIKKYFKRCNKNYFIDTEHKGVEYNYDVVRPNQEVYLYRAN